MATALEDVATVASMNMINRGLTDSATWVTGLVVSFDGQTDSGAHAPFHNNCIDNPPRGFTATDSGLVVDARSADNSPASLRVVLARALLQRQEYRRVIHVLRGENTDEAVFLQHYAWYLDGERQTALAVDAMGESASTGGLSTFEGSSAPSDVPQTHRLNPYLPELLRALGSIVVQPATDAVESPATPEVLHSVVGDHTRLSFHNDPYLVWLYGLVANRSGLTDVAVQAFASACMMEPLLWCAWKDLSSLMRSESQLTEVITALRSHCVCFPWTVTCFAATARLRLANLSALMDDVAALEATFPNASFVQQLRAQAHTVAKEHEAAKAAFLQLRTTDAYRLEGMDEFSNVLFVLGDRRGLSSLALDCFAVDPFRAESNCVAGNLYGMMGQHDRSILHFRRAVSLDPACVAAWTLLGHEYLEVRNTSAAVSAYRSAISLNERDYRAWYGLGQIYELLQLYPYALHYYQRTTSMRPSDARMWIATAGCLEKLSRNRDAVTCLERAAACESRASESYSTTLRRIAQHCAQADAARAAAAYEDLLDAPRCKPQEAAEAMLFLVNYFCDRADGMLDLPTTAARAPSFDPYSVTYLDGVHGTSSRGSAATNRPVPSGDGQTGDAKELIKRAESLLDELAVSLGDANPLVTARRARVDRIRRVVQTH